MRTPILSYLLNVGFWAVASYQNPTNPRSLTWKLVIGVSPFQGRRGIVLVQC